MFDGSSTDGVPAGETQQSANGGILSGLAGVVG